MRVGFWIWGALFFPISQGYATPISPFSPAVTPAPPASTIQTFLDPERKGLVSVNHAASFPEGSVLYVYRQDLDSSQVPIETGKIKILRTTAGIAVAEVLEDGSPLSRKVFPQFPGIMAGDPVTLPNLLVARSQQALPERELLYRDLFVAPAAHEQNYALSEAGMAKLREFATQLGGGYFSQLLVEGFTDESGDWNENQLESYQRALTVRSFLVEVLKFDPERVLAVGQGEAGLSNSSHIPGPGYEDQNRRIALRVLTAPESGR